MTYKWLGLELPGDRQRHGEFDFTLSGEVPNSATIHIELTKSE